MIVTVTLNPALVVRYDAAAVELGADNPVIRVGYAVGGRGLAVARLLHTFGHEVVAAGLVGGGAGELIRNELARAGVATQFTPIAAESRRVVLVCDSAGRVTSLAEPAPYVTTEELGRLAADYRGLLDDATAVVLSGSLPDSLPAEIYGSFASYAADARVPVVLDAAGAALRHGAARHPALVIPDLGWQQAKAPAEPAAAAASPVASATERGVRVQTTDGEWRAELRSAGPGPASRDALVAGFVPGIALAWSWPDMLRHAVAIAVAWQPASAGPSGARDHDLDIPAYEAALTAVDVRWLPGPRSAPADAADVEPVRGSR